MSVIGDPQQIVRSGAMAPGYLPDMLEPGPLGPPGGGPPGAAAAGVGAGDIWRIIMQRKAIVAITAVVLYALVCIGTFIVWKFFPAFPAEAYLKLEPPNLEPMKPVESIVPKEFIETQIQTEAASMKQLDILLDLLKQEQIKNTKFFKWYDSLEECMYDLRDLLAVSPVRDSYLIKVRLDTRDPKESTLIVNTLVERYLQRYRDRESDDVAKKVATLKSSQDEVERDLKNLRSRVSALRSQRDMPAMESERMVLVNTIAQLNNYQTDFLARRADMEAQLKSLQGVDFRNLPLSNEMRVLIEMDPVLRMYRQQVEQFDIELGVVSKHKLGKNHDAYRLLQERRQAFADIEFARREELINDLRGRQQEALNQEFARLNSMLIAVKDQLSQHEATQRDLDKSIQEFQNLLKDEEVKVMRLNEISSAVVQAEHSHELKKQQARLTIQNRAVDAYEPSRPNLPLFLGGGAVLALAGAIGLAFLLEFTDKKVRTPLDVARHGHLSVLGTIPQLDDEEVEIENIEDAARKAPQSLLAESFRQVRAHLTFSGPKESQRILLLTSAGPGDGKTAMAVNLAATFAQSNQRTLLIDANFRKPGVRNIFGIAANEGLSNVLIGQKRLDEVIHKTDLPNLDVLVTGPMPPNPAELLSSVQMSDLIMTARGKYDRVIFDGPPCLLVSDAQIIATLVDGVILVARAVHNSKGILKRARESLDRVNARVLGAILNGAETRAGGYFKQKYREFYEYTADETVPPELPEDTTREAAASEEKPTAEAPAEGVDDVSNDDFPKTGKNS